MRCSRGPPSLQQELVTWFHWTAANGAWQDCWGGQVGQFAPGPRPRRGPHKSFLGALEWGPSLTPGAPESSCRAWAPAASAPGLWRQFGGRGIIPPRDPPPKTPDQFPQPAPGEGFALTILLLLVSHRTQLEELQDVLEKLQSKRISTWKKKYNQVPKCFIGQACAVKKGARIGRLCDCPRGATCNSFLLRCL
uniref:Uncharacterized protein n=1 Tax=Gopherus agassizii TaxID=38772 RepID=A0A452GH78_9SAUR